MKKSLVEKIAKSIENDFPFVMYRKPNSNKVEAVFQNNQSINYTLDFSEKGFVFAPFDDAKKTLIIPFAKAELKSFPFQTKEINELVTEVDSIQKKDWQFHIDLVQKGIDFINSSKAQKIVLSRKEIVKIENFNLFSVFEKLLHHYSNAFVYAWFHPLTGLWMGATPETLLKVQGNKFNTMALASTQKYQGILDVNWRDKEKQEHQFVTDYIESKLNHTNLKISKPFTVKAGNLLHICSKIDGVFSLPNQLNALIKILHPTPAICGIPKEAAKQFILQNENYDREFYTGFLGEINQDSFSNLYVNLRCMKVDKQKNEISIFIGGGITKDSIPEKEWNETVIKSKVMKKVLYF
ncbi:MAG: isochorismate synthase [Flavobacteriaceae bacterium]|nr:isochorismate synthase [Flavobacteriaceae bacterium]